MCQPMYVLLTVFNVITSSETTVSRMKRSLHELVRVGRLRKGREMDQVCNEYNALLDKIESDSSLQDRFLKYKKKDR